MKLFDNIQRLESNLGSYSEPSFVFLNRTSRSEFTQVRDLLEVWFEHYPLDHQPEFRSRFRSVNNFQHQAAFFELFLHELLLRLGCKLTLHPILGKTAKVPDFLVEPPDGQDFFLEATLTTGESSDEAAARARENIVYDVIDRLVDSPDYFLSLTVIGSPESPPPARKLANRINDELHRLDYDEIVRIYEQDGFQNLPTWRFDHGRWHIEVQPIPKFKLRGQSGVRPIGSRSTDFRMVDHWTPIRDSILEKGRKYGELDLPYVIAVSTLEPVDIIDIMQALYGQEEFIINFSNMASGSREQNFRRKPNGVWVGPKGPQYTRISAVLMVKHLSTYSIPRADLQLFHNPWAQRPYESVLTQLEQAVPIDGKINWVSGKSAAEIFELTASWPENAA